MISTIAARKHLTGVLTIALKLSWDRLRGPSFLVLGFYITFIDCKVNLLLFVKDDIAVNTIKKIYLIT